MAAESVIGQRGRLAILMAYLGGLFIASWGALGTWIPPTSEKGIWFYAALAALLLGSLLVTPFYTTPADAISYAVAAIVALLAANVWGSAAASGFDRFVWSAAMLYVLVGLAAAILAISLKDSSSPAAQKTARSGLLLADAAGSPCAIFSVVFLFALITYHRAVQREYFIIGLAWALFVGLRPLEATANLWCRWRALWAENGAFVPLGEVVGHEAPGLVLIREDGDSSATIGDTLLVRTEGGRAGLAIALDHVGFADGCWLRAIHLRTANISQGALGNAAVARLVADGSVFRAGEDAIKGPARAVANNTRQRLLGLVASDTNVGQLQVELVRSDLDLQEGSLVEVETCCSTRCSTS